MKLPSVNVGGYGKSRLDFSGDNPADALEDMYEAAIQRLKHKDNTVVQFWAADTWNLEYRQLRTLIMASWALGNGLLVFFGDDIHWRACELAESDEICRIRAVDLCNVNRNQVSWGLVLLRSAGELACKRKKKKAR